MKKVVLASVLVATGIFFAGCGESEFEKETKPMSYWEGLSFEELVELNKKLGCTYPSEKHRNNKNLLSNCQNLNKVAYKKDPNPL